MKVTGTPILCDTGAVQSVVRMLSIGSAAFHVDITVLGVAAPQVSELELRSFCQ